MSECRGLGGRRRCALRSGVIALLLALASTAAARAETRVRGVTALERAGATRITVELSVKAKPVLFHLPADPATGRPERVGLHFESATLDLPGPGRIVVGDGRVSTVRYGPTPDGGVRVLVDLLRPTRHRAMRHVGPHRIELDVMDVAR